MSALRALITTPPVLLVDVFVEASPPADSIVCPPLATSRTNTGMVRISRCIASLNRSASSPCSINIIAPSLLVGFSAFAKISKRCESSHAGPPVIWCGPTPYAPMMHRFNVTFSASSRPCDVSSPELTFVSRLSRLHRRHFKLLNRLRRRLGSTTLRPHLRSG